MRRRQFLCSSLMAGGAAAAALRDFPYHLFASDRKKYATDVVTLGRTGIKLSRLAQGSGTVGTNKSSNQTRKLGLYGLSDLYRATVDAGLNFWDTADQYGSHPHICEALKTVKREGVVIMTKTRASTEAEMRDDLDRFRRELGTDYLDIVLLHCMLDTDWPEKKKGAMMVLSEAKEKGIIRAHGTSCHKIGALRTAAATDWVEVDLARLNPVGSHMDADAGTVISVLREMKAKGKGVIGMKILGEGDLRNEVDKALAYALAADVLDCFTIGAESRSEMEDLVRKIPAASVRG
ncbi:MAG: aldo/keto reductase [Acidobacteria bacterium]|nr:MAG: aldo/keto reductase [Acidobacteriota bacterium]